MVQFGEVFNKLEGITVIMINAGRNYKWFERAKSAVMGQIYPCEIELKIMDNTDRKLTIGRCWNELIRHAKFNYIFVFDDDDTLAPMLLFNLMFYLQRIKLSNKNKDIIGVSPHLTLVEDGKKSIASNYYTSGLIEKKWLLKVPFDETLERGIDIAWDNAIAKKGKAVAIQDWNHGFYYRQHDQMVSGRNMDERLSGRLLNEMVDIVI
jgi:hypothetical protein